MGLVVLELCWAVSPFGTELNHSVACMVPKQVILSKNALGQARSYFERRKKVTFFCTSILVEAVNSRRFDLLWIHWWERMKRRVVAWPSATRSFFTELQRPCEVFNGCQHWDFKTYRVCPLSRRWLVCARAVDGRTWLRSPHPHHHGLDFQLGRCVMKKPRLQRGFNRLNFCTTTRTTFSAFNRRMASMCFMRKRQMHQNTNFIIYS